MSVVAIGNFDGLHLGHRVLLKKAAELAQNLGLESVAFTFTPHPRNAPRLMSDVSKKRGILGLGLERVVFQAFAPEFSTLSPQDFVEQILVTQLKAKHVVVGPGFAFGHKASGRAEMLLADKRFQTHIVEPVMVDGELCSSSAIREAIGAGDLDKAKRFLGRPYSLSGTVVEGSHRGRLLGFPTANLAVEQEILPPVGVYEVRSGDLKGVMNIGHRPTFGGDAPVFVETHFLDFNGNLYGQYLEIELLRFIRPEMKFESVEALKAQIKHDVDTLVC